MGKTYLGARRKRTNSPVENRKRAVEFRHERYARKTAEAVLPVVEETAAEPAVETVIETAAEKFEETVVHAKEEIAKTGFDGSGFLKKVTGFFAGLFGVHTAAEAVKETAGETAAEEESVLDKAADYFSDLLGIEKEIHHRRQALRQVHENVRKGLLKNVYIYSFHRKE